MTISRRDIWSAVNFFMLVACTALSLSFTVSLLFYKMGLPTDISSYVRLNLFVSGCVALPTAIIASLHDFHMRAYQRRLEEMAWTDALTGLLNRRFFIHAAEEERSRMRRTKQSAAIVLIDLDHFKEVNDLYGHSGGDLVLKEIAAIAHSELRGPFDRLGRWGGEEFVVLLSCVSKEHAMIVCERLRRRIEAATIFVGDKEVSVTASFGLCMMSPETPLNAAIDCADGALYEVKRLGRNKVLFRDVPEGEAAPIVTSLPIRRRFGQRIPQNAVVQPPANDGAGEPVRKAASS
ncbi:diguanylate cyclase [Hyphomonas neptunium ATCC 15444]|uniref:diguanylate cyclase n=2 Tax=Hyphomonas TaxID=85 RepID=Q0C0T2_HYPNA|nr:MULTISPECIES: GGDEF domain-containing protein [Hyphomonas]ABI76191.1 diguanylate cyclase [Hyphomonas neptunium ATCC 15444]KCZ88226.1 diguanylate cyclase [Hyphomonas hirschiana VP5]